MVERWSNGLVGKKLFVFTMSTLLVDVNLMQVLGWCIREFFFRSRRRWLANELSQQFVCKFLMAMRDCDVFVLLVVAWIWILQAFGTKALLQLCCRCQINFIASDTFLGWISFKGEKRRKELRWSPMCCTWNGNMDSTTKKSFESHQTEFKIQSILQFDSIFLSFYVLFCVSTTQKHETR